MILRSIIISLICFFQWAVVHAELSERQSRLLSANCMQCHGDTSTTAPVLGAPESWKSALSQTEDETLANVVNGIRGMPPLGYCSACSEEDLRVLIRFMLGTVDE